MPNAQQIREERIQLLVNAFKKCPEFVDPIILKARQLFPFVREQTIKDYAATAWRILRAR